MAFFGLENNGLEEERRRYREGRLGNGEDIAVFNWGGDDYDGLGNALQEGGDDLNDETFGGSGPVGRYPLQLCSCIKTYRRRQGFRFHCATTARGWHGVETARAAGDCASAGYRRTRAPAAVTARYAVRLRSLTL